MNGVNIGNFDINAPTDSDRGGRIDDFFRSLKTTFQQALNDEHVFDSAGGTVGAHRLGTARPYFCTQSQVSSSGTDGKLALTSDTSRLFGVGSAGTVLLGGATSLLVGSFPGATPQRHYWALEFGEGQTSSSGSTVVTIPNSGYSGQPYLFVTVQHLVTGSNVHAQVVKNGGATFVVSTIAGSSSAFAADQGFYWASLGTRAL